MQLYYLIRRIMPDNSQHHPSFQLVCCNADRTIVEAHLERLSQHESLAKIRACSYAIECHSDSLSGKELELRWLQKQKKEKELERFAAEAKQNRTWADYDVEMMSEGTNL